MAKGQKFHVEYHHESLGWRNVFGAEGTRQFCEGYVFAMDSCYPSRPHRIIRTNPNGSIDVMRETKGHAAPHVN